VRKQETYNSQPEGIESATDAVTVNNETGSAFAYLKSLPRNLDRPVLDSYKRGKDSAIIDSVVAEDFTTSFRGVTDPFFIPVSWTMSKSSLVNLLGITSYEDYEEVNGVRFYAGINSDNQLTLIAVSTMAGTGCHDDLTEDEAYPYYDFADPCPVNCSNRGNLKAVDASSLKVIITD
jgi:hypothetical protein